MATANGVTLLDFWASMFGIRVRVALAEKGIEYRHQQEDLRNKSPLLLRANPVHKKIPVLIHDDKPICESLLILHYIDEVWPHRAPLLPSDPHRRAQARFWADLVDQKVFGSGRRIWSTKGEEREAAKDEFLATLKLFEEELGDKPYFGGEAFGYVDVALVAYYSWFYSYETFGGFSVGAHCPRLAAWALRCMEKDSVSRTLPDEKKIFDFVLQLRNRLGIKD